LSLVVSLNLTLTVNLSNISDFIGTFVSSCIYKAVGDKVVISFDDAKLQEDNELRWIHNQRRVYWKKGSQVKHSELNTDQYGSLILENVQKDKSGEYRGIIYDAEGKFIKETVQHLCVLEPVAEPIVLVECVEKGVNLNCSAVNNNEVVVSWMKNDMKANVTHAVLHVTSSELKPGDNFSCTVSNQISKKSAKNVEPVCSDTDMSEKRFLFGLDLWWMLVILTGGGSFLLILVIICLVCVCRCCRQNKRKAKRTSSVNYFQIHL
uniref:Ig-like domain-containing protein n=1 Tax=Cyprinus carpio TaxID=7962 RepID=A0A8C2I1X6_CYPCA